MPTPRAGRARGHHLPAVGAPAAGVAAPRRARRPGDRAGAVAGVARVRRAIAAIARWPPRCPARCSCRSCARCPMGLRGLRVPQSGWIDQGGHAGPVTHGGIRERVKPHRIAGSACTATPTTPRRSTTTIGSPTRCSPPTPTALGLYDKPLAKQRPRLDPRLSPGARRADAPIAPPSPPRRAPSPAAGTSAIAFTGCRCGSAPARWCGIARWRSRSPRPTPRRPASRPATACCTRPPRRRPPTRSRCGRAPTTARRGSRSSAGSPGTPRPATTCASSSTPARAWAPRCRARLATRLVSADRTATWATWRAALAARATDDTAARVVTAAIDRTLVDARSVAAAGADLRAHRDPRLRAALLAHHRRPGPRHLARQEQRRWRRAVGPQAAISTISPTSWPAATPPRSRVTASPVAPRSRITGSAGPPTSICRGLTAGRATSSTAPASATCSA
jgi:hypothetical protein